MTANLSPIGQVARALLRVSWAFGVCLTVVGCAASAALHQGQQAEQAQDYDRAVVEYTRRLD